MTATITEPRVAEPAVQPSSSPAEPLIAMRAVSKSYGSGVTCTEVLHEIDLESLEGEFLAVVGFSGSSFKMAMPR